jgi:hypothetical protein
MYQRDGGMFYAKDRKTGQRLSLSTTDFAEAKRLLAAKNQATEQPCLNVATAEDFYVIAPDLPGFGFPTHQDMMSSNIPLPMAPDTICLRSPSTLYPSRHRSGRLLIMLHVIPRLEDLFV